MDQTYSPVKVAKNLLTFLLVVAFGLLVVLNIVFFYLPHPQLLDLILFGW